MAARGVRRLVLDLTPLIDIVTIMLFGVMINSFLRFETDTSEAKKTAAEAAALSKADRAALVEVGEKAAELREFNEQLHERLAEAESLAKKSAAERAELEQRMAQQKLNLAKLMANLLQMDNPEQLTFRKQLETLSQAGANRLQKAAEESQPSQDPVKVYKAVRRIEEMQKVFTFIDLYLADNDFLSITANTTPMDRLPVRGKSAEEIENGLRQALEAVNFNQMVLLMFSYSGEARDLAVENSEKAIESLLLHYRAQGAASGKHFRYGRIGLVETPAVTTDGKEPMP